MPSPAPDHPALDHPAPDHSAIHHSTSHHSTSHHSTTHHSTTAGTAATRRSYDAVADRYALEVGGELAGKPADRALLDAVATADGIVADLGCGPGHVAAYLVERGARVVGLDLSPQMCRLARRTGRAGGSAGLPAVAADLTGLPLGSATLGGFVCLYAVIHLDRAQRRAAYAEFARVLRPGARGLIAFHTSAADHATGSAVPMTEWWDQPVDLTFRYLDPDEETTLLAGAGLRVVDRLDREPYPGVEHASRRSYLTVSA